MLSPDASKREKSYKRRGERFNDLTQLSDQDQDQDQERDKDQEQDHEHENS